MKLPVKILISTVLLVTYTVIENEITCQNSYFYSSACNLLYRYCTVKEKKSHVKILAFTISHVTYCSTE